MLTIRKSQMDEFSRSTSERFVDKMVARIGEENPEFLASKGEPGVRAYVLETIEDAAGLGIKVEGAVAGLIRLRVEFGKEFELSPDRVWALEILRHTALPDVLRISMISDRFEARTQGRKIVKVQPQEIK